MKYILIVIATFIGYTQSAPQPQQQQQRNIVTLTTEPIPIIRQEQEINPDGSYKWLYETGNGIAAQELGYLENLGIKDEESRYAEGQYSYTAPDGQFIQVRYVADRNGFRAEGDHIPKIPPLIQRALEYLATAPTPTERIPPSRRI